MLATLVGEPTTVGADRVIEPGSYHLPRPSALVPRTALSDAELSAHSLELAKMKRAFLDDVDLQIALNGREACRRLNSAPPREPSVDRRAG